MPSEEDLRAYGGVVLSTPDRSDFTALRAWIAALQEVEVAVVPGIPGPGDLGVLDVLMVVAGSGGAMEAIRTLPDFIRSRRSGIRIETTVAGQSFVLDATNVDEIMPILERLLDE